MNNSEHEQVRTWMGKFKQPIPTTISIPDVNIRKLRARLMLTEVIETIKALGFDIKICDLYQDADATYISEVSDKDWNILLDTYHEPNLIKILDGTADTRVVAHGTEISLGVDKELSDKIFSEIMRSNDSKLWTRNEVINTQGNPNKYSFSCIKDGCDGSIPCIAALDERCILTLDAGGKVIKSPSYSPPDIEQFLPSYAKE
jgi:hypothetical protein